MTAWKIKLSNYSCPHICNGLCGQLCYRKKCSFENCPIKVEEKNENT